MLIEKRHQPRAQITWPVTLIGLDGLIRGETGNLSLAGALVYCSELPDTNGNLGLILKAAEQQTIPATAEIVWSNTLIGSNNSNKNGHAIGVCFTHIPESDRRLLSAMISNHLKIEYLKRFFAKRIRCWRITILDKMKLHNLKCHRCKTDLLLGPVEEICPVCQNPLSNSVNF